jgi:hypothetical protein
MEGGLDLESSEQALRALAASVVRRGRRSSAAAAAPFLIALLDRGERPSDPEAILALLAQIATGDPETAACRGEATLGGALEATVDEQHAEHEALGHCREAVAAGRGAYLLWLVAESVSARSAAAHVLAFVARDDRCIDGALSARARDEGENPAVRCSALFALGVRGTACAADLPQGSGQDFGPATSLEAASAFAALGAKDAVLAKAAERSAVDVLARGVATSPDGEGAERVASPWPSAERLLLGRLARAKGRSARAQSTLLRLLAVARDRDRAERISAALLVLAFGEPTAAAFSDWRPSLERFPGASAWSAEQRAVLRAIAGQDLLWPASAEQGPSVRHVDASPVQVALKQTLELSYYPSRKGLRTAITLAFSAGAGGVGR